MSADLSQGSPLANALNEAIQLKIADLGWASAGAEGAAMSEYFVLMLANGKTAADISAEISGDLLGLGPEDQTAPAFAQWLVDQHHTLVAQMSAAAAPAPNGQGAMMEQDESMDAGFDAHMDAMTDGSATELNAYVAPPSFPVAGPHQFKHANLSQTYRSQSHARRPLSRHG